MRPDCRSRRRRSGSSEKSSLWTPPPNHACANPVRRPGRRSLEPRVPPRRLLDRINGRVLDPSTALTVKGSHRRRRCTSARALLVSRGERRGAAISDLDSTAGRLGWTVTVSRSRTEVIRVKDQRDLARAPSGTPSSGATTAASSPTSPPGEVVRLDLGPDTGTTTARPTGGCCCRTPARWPPTCRVQHVGLDHVCWCARTTSRTPTTRATRSRRVQPGRGWQQRRLARYGRRGSGGRQPMSFVGARRPARRASTAAGPSWPRSTPAAATTRGCSGWSTTGTPRQ